MAIEKHSTVEADLLGVIDKLLQDLKNFKAVEAVSLHANLNNDLGIGSLERLELLSRLERHFGLHLSPDDLFSVVYVKDLLPLLGVNNPSLKRALSLEQTVKAQEKARQNIWYKLKAWLWFFPKFLYSCYFYLIAIITTLITWIAAWLVPGKSKIFPYLAHYWARIFLFLVGCPLKVKGRENIIAQRPLLFIANHASYLDTAILCASIPHEIVFVAKVELLNNWILMPFFRKQQHISVRRSNFSAAAKAVSAIKKSLQLGCSVMIYPEATFVYTPGLRLFKLGAFKVAAETHTPICPIAIKGARSLMDAHFWVQPTRIEVSILPLLYPEGEDLTEMVRLRDISRELIAKEINEPILNLAAGGVLSEDNLG